MTAPAPVEAHPSWTRYRIEVPDPGNGEWLAAGSPHASLADAGAALDARLVRWPHITARIVREAMTYTVVVPARAVVDVPTGGVL